MFPLIRVGLKTLIRVANPSIAKINLAVTWRCNYRCQTCNIWQVSDHDAELLLDEIGILIERNDAIWMAITGGEPFLRRDISEILKMAMLKYTSVSITTNGSLPETIDKSAWYALKGNDNLLTVNVSLNGDKEQHDGFSGQQGAYEKATETIDRLLALRNSRLKLTIENVVSIKTFEGLGHVKDYAKSKGIALTHAMEMRSDFYNNKAMPYEGNSIPEPEFYLGNPFDYLYLRQAKRGRSVECVAGQYDCAISPNGVVKPCWFISKEAYNIRETGYRIIPLRCEESVRLCNELSPCWTPCNAYTTMIFRPWRVL